MEKIVKTLKTWFDSWQLLFDEKKIAKNILLNKVVTDDNFNFTKKNCGNYSIEKNREKKVEMDDLDFVKTTLISREKMRKIYLLKKVKLNGFLLLYRLTTLIWREKILNFTIFFWRVIPEMACLTVRCCRDNMPWSSTKMKDSLSWTRAVVMERLSTTFDWVKQAKSQKWPRSSTGTSFDLARILSIR